MYNDIEIEKVKDLFLKRCKRILDLDGCPMKSSNAGNSKMIFKSYGCGCLGLEIDGHLWSFICFNEDGPYFRVFNVEKLQEDGFGATVPDREALEILLEAAVQYDVFILGTEFASLVLLRGETLESLLIESDLKRRD